jgi:peptidoglycan hydrolase CwlO-like protein
MPNGTFETQVTGSLSEIKNEIENINKNLDHIRVVVESDHDEISKLAGKDELHSERHAQLGREIAKNCQSIAENRKWLVNLDKRDRAEARWIGGMGALGIILASIDHIWAALTGG